MKGLNIYSSEQKLNFPENFFQKATGKSRLYSPFRSDFSYRDLIYPVRASKFRKFGVYYRIVIHLYRLLKIMERFFKRIQKV